LGEDYITESSCLVVKPSSHYPLGNKFYVIWNVEYPMSKHENLGVQLDLPIQQNVEAVALHSFNYIFVDWWLFNSPMTLVWT
jgi:hypothetical protein